MSDTQPTAKQQKLLDLIYENLGVSGKTKSWYELLKEAGYSDGVAKNPRFILESEFISSHTDDFVKKLAEKRDQAIKKLTDEKLDEATASDLATIVEKMNKNHQLLSGNETERHGVKEINVIKNKDASEHQSDNQTD